MSKIEAKTGQNKKSGPEDIVLKPGPRIKHGGYSFLRTGRMPKEKARIEKYLTWLRMTYIEDIASTEDNLTAGQTILLNKLILLEGLCRCIEVMAAEITEKTGVLYNMPDKYLGYVNTIAKICNLLGIKRMEIEVWIPTPQEVAAEVDREKESDRIKTPFMMNGVSLTRRKRK